MLHPELQQDVLVLGRRGSCFGLGSLEISFREAEAEKLQSATCGGRERVLGLRRRAIRDLIQKVMML